MFLNRGEDDIVDKIEARIAKHTAIPRDNGEGLQILHYQVPPGTRPHGSEWLIVRAILRTMLAFNLQNDE